MTRRYPGNLLPNMGDVAAEPFRSSMVIGTGMNPVRQLAGGKPFVSRFFGTARGDFVRQREDFPHDRAPLGMFAPWRHGHDVLCPLSNPFAVTNLERAADLSKDVKVNRAPPYGFFWRLAANASSIRILPTFDRLGMPGTDIRTESSSFSRSSGSITWTRSVMSFVRRFVMRFSSVIHAQIHTFPVDFNLGKIHNYPDTRQQERQTP